jgi:hypothetical protein
VEYFDDMNNNEVFVVFCKAVEKEKKNAQTRVDEHVSRTDRDTPKRITNIASSKQCSFFSFHHYDLIGGGGSKFKNCFRLSAAAAAAGKFKNEEFFGK